MTTKKEERRVARWIALVARVVALAAFLLAPLNVFSDEIGGKRYAVLIGINDYDDYPEISLNFCASDVEALADTLQRAGYDEIIILDSLTFDAPKTKNMVETLKNIGAAKKALIVTAEKDVNVVRSAANIPGVRTAVAGSISVYDIINHTSFIVTQDAIKQIEGVYEK